MIAPYWNKRGGRHTQRQQPEAKFHVLVARFLNMALPLDAWWTTIPTVGSSILQGAKLKAKGYKAGTPDLVIIYNAGVFWIELKAPEGVLSDEQENVHRLICAAGGHTGMARSLDNVQMLLDYWHIKPLRARLPSRQPAAVDAARAGGE